MDTGLNYLKRTMLGEDYGAMARDRLGRIRRAILTTVVFSQTMKTRPAGMSLKRLTTCPGHSKTRGLSCGRPV